MTLGLTVQSFAAVMAALALLPSPVRAHDAVAPAAPMPALVSVPASDERPAATTQMPRRAQPPRDPRTGAEQPPPVATAVIRGRVIDGVTSQPVRRATVVIPGREIKPIKTDETGSFTFTALRAGSYQLRAQKSGYLAGQYPDVSRETMRTRRTFTLADGQAATITLPLYRGAVITGRVLDEFGDPVDRAMVRVFSANPRDLESGYGSRMAIEATNEAGEFRIGRLREGRYMLSVRSEMDEMRVRFNAGAEDDEPQDGYVTTYYPDVVSLDQAGTFTVERGQTLSGIDVTLATVPRQLLTGTVTDAKGLPIESFHARILPVQSDGEVNTFDEARSIVQREGRFRAWVPPGEYEVTVTSFSLPKEANGASVPRSEYARVRVTVGNEPAYAAVVTSPGAVVTGRIVFDGDGKPPVPTSAGAIHFMPVRGRMDGCRLGGSSTVRPDGTFTMANVWGLCRASGNMRIGDWQLKSIRHGSTDITDRPVDLTRVAELRDVEVTLTNRRSGMTLEVTGPSGSTTEYVALVFSTDKSRWMDYSAVHTWMPADPAEAGAAGGGSGGSLGVGRGPGIALGSGGGAAFEQGPAAGGQGSAGGSSVAVATLSGRIASRAMIGWSSGVGPGGMMGGSMRGLGSLSNLRPGEYYVVALDDVETDRVQDPAFLEVLAGMATRVTLAEGEQRTVSLRRQAAPDEER